jgi:hypothetical protein
MASSNAYRFLWEAGVGAPIPPWRELEGITSCGKDKPETTMTLPDLLVRDDAALAIEYAHDTAAVTAVKQDDADHRTAAGTAERRALARVAVRRPRRCCRRSGAHRNRERGTYDRDDDESMHGVSQPFAGQPRRLGQQRAQPRRFACGSSPRSSGRASPRCAARRSGAIDARRPCHRPRDVRALLHPTG